MALDPSIALGTRGIVAPNMVGDYGQALQLRSLVDQQGINALQRKKMLQDFADADAEREAAMQAGGDMTRLRDLLYQRGAVQRGLAVDKQLNDSMKSKAELDKIRAETLSKTMGNFRDRAAMVNDQGGYDALRESGQQMFGPDFVRALPAQFSPDSLRLLVMDAGKRADALMPKVVSMNDGQVTRFTDTNPMTNPGILGTTIQMQATPGDVLSDTTRRSEGEANRAQQAQLAREAAARAGKVWDTDRGGVVNTQTNMFTPAVTAAGTPVGPKDTPLNEVQSNALMFGARMKQSDSILNNLSAKGVQIGVPGAGNVGAMGDTINALSPAEQQQLTQAKRNFVTALLRKESGAAISTGEFATADRQYFPQVGDSPEVIAQKAQNRKLAIDGMMAAVPGTKRDSLKVDAGMPAPEQPAAAPKPKVFKTLPDPAENSGKWMQSGGTWYQSDGTKWVRK